MKHIGIAALAIALMSSGAAYGADIYNPSTKDAPGGYSAATANWTGLWIGALGGIAFGSNKLNYDQSQEYGEGYSQHGGIEVDGLSDRNLFGELQLGGDYQLGNIVFGAFGGLNMGTGEFKASMSGGDSEGESFGSAELTFSQKWGGVVGPRIGYARGKTLIYAAGGVAFGEMEKVKASVSDGDESVSGDVFAEQETDLFGWFGELGVEHKLNENIAFKLAGRYTDFGKIDLAKRSDEGYSDKLTLDRDTLVIVGGLTFHTNTIRPNLD